MEPKFALAERRGWKDCWRIHDAHRAAIGEKLLQLARRHPEFKSLLQNHPSPRMADPQGARAEALPR